MTFSEALKHYKQQKQAFKQAEEALFSLFRCKRRPRKTTNLELPPSMHTERGIDDQFFFNRRSELEPGEDSKLFLRTHMSAAHTKHRTTRVSGEHTHELPLPT